MQLSAAIFIKLQGEQAVAWAKARLDMEASHLCRQTTSVEQPQHAGVHSYQVISELCACFALGHVCLEPQTGNTHRVRCPGVPGGCNHKPPCLLVSGYTGSPPAAKPAAALKSQPAAGKKGTRKREWTSGSVPARQKETVAKLRRAAWEWAKAHAAFQYDLPEAEAMGAAALKAGAAATLGVGMSLMLSLQGNLSHVAGMEQTISEVACSATLACRLPDTGTQQRCLEPPVMVFAYVLSAIKAAHAHHSLAQSINCIVRRLMAGGCGAG